MPEAIPPSVAVRAPLVAYLSSDHITPATGKTIAVTISKNGAAFGNPAAGATTAIEIGQGAYYVDLGTSDTNTAGPLLVRGAEGTIDDVLTVYSVRTGAGDPWSTALPGAYGAGTAGKLVGDNLNATVSSRATPAQVNAEVVDVLTVDTSAELAAPPAATSSIAARIGWLFLLAKNLVRQTATEQTVRNSADAATVGTAAVSDDGTTFERGAWS